METVIFAIYQVFILLCAYQDGKDFLKSRNPRYVIRNGKKVLHREGINHKMNLIVRIALTLIAFWVMLKWSGSIMHAASFAALAAAFAYPVFDSLMSLQITKGESWGYIGTTAFFDRITPDEFHIQIKLAILIIATMLYGHFGYNVYIDEKSQNNHETSTYTTDVPPYGLLLSGSKYKRKRLINPQYRISGSHRVFKSNQYEAFN